MKVDTQLLLIAGGAAAIVVAFAWRFLARRRRLSRLMRHLRLDENPVGRARAGNAVIELGLPVAARGVLRAMALEHDDRVRLSIALAIARRQWEPTRARRVVNLRKWASEELEFQGHPVRGLGPAITRLADMGGPRVDKPDEPANGTNGHGTAPAASTVDAPDTSNGNGASGSEGGDQPDEPTAPVPPVSTGGDIRWVAPDVADQTHA
jgi:hypothetical protein